MLAVLRFCRRKLCGSFRAPGFSRGFGGFSASLRGAFCAVLVSGCAAVAPEPPEPKSPEIVPEDSRVAVSWAEIPGWMEDSHDMAAAAFLRGCEKLAGEWAAACAAAKKLPPDKGAARRFFEEYFTPYQLLDENGGKTGLITGYYEPLLEGALSPSARFRYPVYGRPAKLLHVELGALYPELKGKRVRGRLAGGKVVPFYTRAEIDGAAAPLAGEELLWVEDKTALFFLHIQGSGLVRLQDGRLVGVGYADQNGRPYRSIGGILARRGDMELAEINLFSLREWLRDNPARADSLLEENQSYVFFALREDAGGGPFGSLGVALTPGRSLAADRKKVPLGAPVWLDTAMPDDESAPLRRLMVAQDTGGAIRGAVRADFFWGRGARAEKMAGLMKTRGALYVLLPR